MERGRNGGSHSLGKSLGTGIDMGRPEPGSGSPVLPGAGQLTSTISTFMEDRVTLVVDNTRFVVDPNVFTQYPNTMLGRSVLTSLPNYAFIS